MTIHGPESIKVEEFVEEWKREILNDLPGFIENMNNIGMPATSFVGWLKTWLAWMELMKDYDITNYYGVE